MKRLTLEPLHETVSVQTNSLLLQTLLSRELNVLMSCGGHGLCATCHVKVKSGMEQLSPRNEREKRTLSFIAGTDEKSRLACQCRLQGEGVVVELPKGMYIERAEDLLNLLGTRAEQDMLHPVNGSVLIARGKIITRARIEELKFLNEDLSRVAAKPLADLRPTAKPDPVAVPPKSAPAVVIAEMPVPAPPQRKIPDPEISLPAIAREVAPIPETVSKFPPVCSNTEPANDTVNIFERPRTIAETTLNGPVPTTSQQTATLSRRIEPGTMLGKCLLMEVIGRGGTGTVYRALHKSLNIPVAVKVLHLKDTDDDQEYRDRLMFEARLLAQLNHPHIVRVWDVEDDPQTPWLVLELVEGLSMSDLIQQSGRIQPDRVVKMMIQMASALSAGWDIGIVHRDVKPANILLTRDGKARLADLGLARVIARDSSASTSGRLNDVAEGTVGYMSPEQAESVDKADFRSDIYSLGATFFHGVTGRLPFPGRSWMEIMVKHASHAVTPVHQIVPQLDPLISRTIEIMMAKKPEDRFADYESLIENLENLLDHLNEGRPQPEPGTDSVTGQRSTWKRLFGLGSRTKNG